jgi:hypothetical protein
VAGRKRVPRPAAGISAFLTIKVNSPVKEFCETIVHIVGLKILINQRIFNFLRLFTHPAYREKIKVFSDHFKT